MATKTEVNLDTKSKDSILSAYKGLLIALANTSMDFADNFCNSEEFTCEECPLRKITAEQMNGSPTLLADEQLSACEYF